MGKFINPPLSPFIKGGWKREISDFIDIKSAGNVSTILTLPLTNRDFGENK